MELVVVVVVVLCLALQLELAGGAVVEHALSLRFLPRILLQRQP